MDISVVIPSYRAEKTIERCLQSISSQTTAARHEIIICDSSPGDEVQKIASRYPVRFVKKTKKVPPGIARNGGAENAEGELLVFVDADIVLEAGALEKIWKCYQRGHEVFSVALELAKESKSFSSHIEHYLFFCEYQRGRRSGERRNLPSTVLAVKKDLFFDLGGFKGYWRGEDTEFTERIRRAGKTLMFIPEIVAHRTQDIPFFEIANKNFKYGVYWGRKHFSNPKCLKKITLVFLLPLLSLLKSGRIVLRNLIYNGSADKLWSALVSPSLFLLGAWWVAGIMASLFSDISDQEERSE